MHNVPNFASLEYVMVLADGNYQPGVTPASIESEAGRAAGAAAGRGRFASRARVFPTAKSRPHVPRLL